MPSRPNILFLMTDHTNAQAIAPGSQCIKPHLDALAAEGVRFARCYTTNAICSPARASLMTGLYASTHGMWDCTHTQRKDWLDVPAGKFPFFPERLAEAGYRNGYFGKWHVEQSVKLDDFGWHEYDAGCANKRGKEIPGTAVMVPKEGYTDYHLAGVCEDDGTGHPAFDKGIDFIRRHVKTHARADGSLGAPFCCFVTTAEPHDPYLPPRRFFDLYDRDAISLSPTLHDVPAGKPEVLQRMRAVWSGLSDSDWRTVAACYWATISFIDGEIGRIISLLKETGQYDNTIIVFTSDHGDMMGAHGLVTKGVATPYEEVYNIPFILRVPRNMTNHENGHAVISMVDVAPTLLDLCGATPIAQCHGRSMRGVLEGADDVRNWQDAYAEFYGQRFVYTQRIVWHENWKYVFSPGGIDELYDLSADPHERNNLADDPAHRPMLLDMTRRMWRTMKAIGDDSLLRSQYATLRTAPVGPEGV